MAPRLIRNSFLWLLLLSIAPLRSELQYEGVNTLFRTYGKIDIHWLAQFLPYNPVVIEAGAFRGDETCRAAKLWPQGRIIAFEPNPEAFQIIQRKIQLESIPNVELHNLALNTYTGRTFLNVCHGMKGIEPVYGYASSLLPLTPEMEIYCKGPQLIVNCVNFEEWCKEHQIDHIDLLRLELEGMELPVLKSCPRILENTKLIYVKTMMHPYRVGMTEYPELREFLEESNFVLVSHWFQPGIIGHAVFASREVFDAYVKLSLGLDEEN